jgi:hypothetical protein
MQRSQRKQEEKKRVRAEVMLEEERAKRNGTGSDRSNTSRPVTSAAHGADCERQGGGREGAPHTDCKGQGGGREGDGESEGREGKGEGESDGIEGKRKIAEEKRTAPCSPCRGRGRFKSMSVGSLLSLGLCPPHLLGTCSPLTRIR